MTSLISLQGALSLPSSDAIYCYGVSTGDPELKAAVEDKGIKSFLHLIAPNTETGSPKNLHGIDPQNTRRVLINAGPDDKPLTGEQATDVIKALDSLPRPTAVACMSGARATAVARLYLASKRGVSAPAVLANATEGEETWVKNGKLVAWVEQSLQEPTFIFRQLFEKESGTYTYLLGDGVSKEALLIDPVDTKVDRDLDYATSLGLKVTIGLNTHAHADHITGTGLLREKIAAAGGGPFQSCISKRSGAKADLLVDDGERLYFGSRYVTARSTPGHTGGCTSFVLDDESMVFTGDTLLIRGCGRTDFQDGSSETLYDSVHNQIFSLPDACRVCPAHDYQGRTESSVGEEKALNPRLGGGKTKAEFVQIMADLKLSNPKMLDIAVPKNMNCGV